MFDFQTLTKHKNIHVNNFKHKNGKIKFKMLLSNRIQAL